MIDRLLVMMNPVASFVASVLSCSPLSYLSPPTSEDDDEQLMIHTTLSPAQLKSFSFLLLLLRLDSILGIILPHRDPDIREQYRISDHCRCDRSGSMILLCAPSSALLYRRARGGAYRRNSN